jgi:hypothetical protein
MPDINDKIREVKEMVALVSNSGYVNKSDYQKDIDNASRDNRKMNPAGKTNEDRKAFEAMIKQLDSLEKNKKMNPAQKEAELNKILNPEIKPSQDVPKFKQALGHVRNALSNGPKEEVKGPKTISTSGVTYMPNAADAVLSTPPSKLFRSSASTNLRDSSSAKAPEPLAPSDSGPKKPGIK